MKRMVAVAAVFGALAAPSGAAAASTRCASITSRSGIITLSGWHAFIQRHVKWCWRRHGSGWRLTFTSSPGRVHWPVMPTPDEDFPYIIWKWSRWFSPKQPSPGTKLSDGRRGWYDMGEFTFAPEGCEEFCEHIIISMNIQVQAPAQRRKLGRYVAVCRVNGGQKPCMVWKAGLVR